MPQKHKRKHVKCIGKAAFSHKEKAIRSAKKWYIKKGLEMGYYECPKCLDYHLTSKWSNLSHRHKKWLRAHVQQQYTEFLALERRLCGSTKALRSSKLRSKRKKHAKPIQPPRKANMLSHEEQRAALARLKEHRASNVRQTWWQKVLSNIKKTLT